MIRRSHLPIYPATNLENDIRLYLHSGLGFPKISYVKTRNPYIFSWRHLNPYHEAKSGLQYKLRADSFKDLLAYANSSLIPAIPRTPAFSSTTPKLAALPLLNTSTYGTVNYASRYNLDIERAGGLSTSKKIGSEPSESMPIPLFYRTQQSLTMNQQTLNPISSSGRSDSRRNLVRGISYPQPGPWTSRSPLVSSNYRLPAPDLYAGLPSNTQHPDTSARSRYNLLIVILFILSVFVTLGYLFLRETKTWAFKNRILNVQAEM